MAAKRRRRNFFGMLGTCAAAFFILLTGLCAMLWAASSFRSIGIFSLGDDLSVRFWAGRAHFERYYAYDIAPPVPEQQWFAVATARGWTSTRRPPWSIPWFHFSSGHVNGIGAVGSNMISPANFWILDIPLWAIMIPGMIVGPWLAVRWRRSDPTRQPRGFEIEPAATTSSN